jgi:hypothetical protein
MSDLTFKLFTAKDLYLGRKLTYDQATYEKEHRQRKPVFDVAICNLAGDAIWWGDLELSIDSEKIQNISEELGMYLFVIPQKFLRYERFNKNMAKNCVFITKEPRQY